MGVVACARHRFTGAEVAVKLLHPQLALHDSAARFLAEARAAAAIGHPAIVATTDAGMSSEGLYLVMELLKGETLGAAIARGPVPFSTVRRIVNDLLDALAAAHAAGFIHRDIKPPNVFLARGAGGVVLKLLDFGIAKVLAETVETKGRTSAGSVMGTLAYMSPEQLTDSRSVDARTDLWAVGVIAFELATGRLPWEARSFAEMFEAHATRPRARLEDHMSAAPHGFEAFLGRALAVAASARFSSATEMQRALALVPDGPLSRRHDARPMHDPFGGAVDSSGGATTPSTGPGGAPQPSLAWRPTGIASEVDPVAGGTILGSALQPSTEWRPKPVAALSGAASRASRAATTVAPPFARIALVIAGVIFAVGVTAAGISLLGGKSGSKGSTAKSGGTSRRTAEAPTASDRPHVPVVPPPPAPIAPLALCERACSEHRKCGAKLASDCATDCADDPPLVACAERALAGSNRCEDLAWCGSESYCKRPLRRGNKTCNAVSACINTCNQRGLGDVACACSCSDDISGVALQRLFNNNVCALTSCPTECAAGSSYLPCVACAFRNCKPEIDSCREN